MENNLIATAKTYISEDKLSKISEQTGETTASLKSGLETIIPSIFLALQNHSGEGLNGVLQQMKTNMTDLEDHESSSLFNKDAPVPESEHTSKQSLIANLFGNNMDSAISTLSNFLHLKSSTVKELIRVAVPAVFKSLSSNGSNWDSTSIANMLATNSTDFAAAIPSGIGLAAFGTKYAELEPDLPTFNAPIDDPTINANPDVSIASANTEKEPIIDPVKDVVINDSMQANVDSKNNPHQIKNPPYQHTPEGVAKNSKVGYWWLLIPVLLVVGWLLFGKSCGNNTPASVVDTTAQATFPTTQTQATHQEITIDLPNGQTLTAFEDGIEYELVKFLESDYPNMNNEQLKEKWFDFDQLNFESGTATITEDSHDQLINLGTILTVFPDAKIKIGGYTDKSGDASINQKLSLDRANAVKSYLEDAGHGSQVVDVEGYGSSFAKYEATAPETDRILDRRISISLRK